ncbi:MAG: hypothetical protein HFH41_14175, partial [Lachnospiraceae bacterium]|nr:hypothetical protein [Lachnospiraceae bacterium]
LFSAGNTSTEIGKVQDTLGKYKYFLLFDLAAIIGFEKKMLASESMHLVIDWLISELKLNKTDKEYLYHSRDAMLGNDILWKSIKSHCVMKSYQEYVNAIITNIDFIEKKPYKILVTATMSAGKSTFVNALTGKNVSLSQNMACTSKRHSVLSKPYEDGYAYEYDHELVMDAGKEELLDDNDSNHANKIIVSTYYNGLLGGKRLIIHDSPGVNYSGNVGHKDISNQLIRSKDYQLLIYVMNATQLGTNDDAEHLQFVKQHIGRKKMLFVVNKIDAFNIDEENIEAAMRKQIKHLENKGFKKPYICPVSSRAAYLSRKSENSALTRVEQRELNCFIDDFEQMELSKYYDKYFPEISIPDEESEEKQLVKNCGIAYVEQMILKLYREAR